MLRVPKRMVTNSVDIWVLENDVISILAVGVYFTFINESLTCYVQLTKHLAD